MMKYRAGSSVDKEREEQKKMKKRTLQDCGVATALSIDQWHPTETSRCRYRPDPSLSVNFLCMHPDSSAPHGSFTDSFDNEQCVPNPDKRVAARYQEIFVDMVGMHCATLDAASRHVLDERFDSFLGSGERNFKDSLDQFMRSLTDDARKTHAYTFLENILQSKMGYQHSYFWKDRINYKRRESREQLNGNGSDSGCSDDDDDNRSSSDSSSTDSSSDESPSWHMHPDPGHCFVVNSSVCNLQCDAFLCPASISLRRGAYCGNIANQWRQQTLKRNKILKRLYGGQSNNGYTFKTYPEYDRVVTLQDWPWEALREEEAAGWPPVPFMVAGEVSIEKTREFADMKMSNGGDLPPQEQHIEALMETVRQYLAVASTELRRNQPKPFCNRERYLLALPVLGTGGGFAGDLTGQIVHNLLCLLSRFVTAEKDFDVVLVCGDETTYAHAQSIRQSIYRFESEDVEDDFDGKDVKHSSKADCDNRREDTLDPCLVDGFTLPCFQTIPAEMRCFSLQLAELASERHLALFLGAGVSMGSGLPSWYGLLGWVEDLFTTTGKPSERRLGNETGWNPLLMADLLDDMCETRCDRDGVKLPLKERICSYLRDAGQRPGLLLALLVSLPCQSIVTQNYDQLIENAFQCWNVADREKKELSVIPYSPNRGAKHWLLKMHGSVVAPNEIIMTGKDYASYESSRSRALSGLVQASLMTKHLLFVGFSLTDPNYHRIIDEVREALLPYNADYKPSVAIAQHDCHDEKEDENEDDMAWPSYYK